MHSRRIKLGAWRIECAQGV